MRKRADLHHNVNHNEGDDGPADNDATNDNFALLISPPVKKEGTLSVSSYAFAGFSSAVSALASSSAWLTTGAIA